jgi:RNA recognition motif-containing protein
MFGKLCKKSESGVTTVNIYVGNLAWDVKDEDLKKAFEAYGQVAQARVITDRYSGKSRGFGFVEMAKDEDGAKAIAELNGKDLVGRPIRVSEANPKAMNGGGGTGGGGGFRSERRDDRDRGPRPPRRTNQR